LDWHRRLVQLRRREPALEDGDLHAVQTRFDEERRWFVLERGPITVACNFAAVPQAITIGAGDHLVLLASANDVQLFVGKVDLPPDSVVILTRRVYRSLAETLQDAAK
jgi:maltooligosyltrehalose trehalohydrolase